MERGMIHHIELNVSNLAKSVEFWEWLLNWFGYESYQIFEHGKSWRRGVSYIVLVQTAEEYVSTSFHRKKTGLNHITFQADSRKNVDELAAECEKRGISLLYSDRYPNNDWYSVYVEDPDRIKVEVVCCAETPV